jgi:hypothetical protein
MAKLALINREEKRRKLVKKYAAKRAELIAGSTIRVCRMRSVWLRG